MGKQREDPLLRGVPSRFCNISSIVNDIIMISSLCMLAYYYYCLGDIKLMKLSDTVSL